MPSIEQPAARFAQSKGHWSGWLVNIVWWVCGAAVAWRGRWWALGVVAGFVIEAVVSDRLIYWQKQMIRLLQPTSSEGAS